MWSLFVGISLCGYYNKRYDVKSLQLKLLKLIDRGHKTYEQNLVVGYKLGDWYQERSDVKRIENKNIEFIINSKRERLTTKSRTI